MKKISLGAKPLLYPMPVVLVATYNDKDKANVMTAAWGGIAASDPPCLSVGIRPSRHTHGAILKRRAFTVNIAPRHMVETVDYVGMFSGRNLDKFTECGLQAVKSKRVDAPYIAQCPVVLECALHETVDLQSHTLMIGRIVNVLADENCLDHDHIPEMHKIEPMVFDTGSRRYYGVGDKIAKAFSVGLQQQK